MREKLYTKEFQQKGSGTRKHEMQVTSKKVFLEKHQIVPNTLHHVAIEKDILLELNKCIFQISLKYINCLS